MPYFASNGRWYPFLYGGYGPWYDAYWYDPFYFPAFGYWSYGGYGAYSPYGIYGPYGAYGGTTAAPREPRHETGSIRLKVSPDKAEVYIDGAKVGVAGDFDGMVSHHLVLEAGTHQIELRASGFETYSGRLVVENGKTLTERISMKKK